MAFPVTRDATWVNPASVTLDGGELRRADSAMFAGIGSALGVGGGVVRHGDTSLAVTVDGSDNVTIQAGAVVIPGNAVAGTGCYRTAIETSTTNALTARHATLGRIDLVVARMLDTDVVGSHTDYRAQFTVIAGTPSATPGVPTLPSMAVELGRISVPATGGGSATVDSSFRTYAAALGGELVVPTYARLPASAAKYQRYRTLDTGESGHFDGSTWAAQGFATGSASGNTDSSGLATITHGLGWTPSRVLITTNANITNAVNNAIFVAGVDTKTSTTFRIRMFYGNSGALDTAVKPYSIDWVAYR